MKRLTSAVLLAAALTLPAAGATLVEDEFAVGRKLPAVDVVDDTGRIRSTADWSGLPTIVAPLYSRCPVACPLITKGLERAVAKSKVDPSRYRVVLFSFDPHDTPEDLRRFRERFRVPLRWSVVSARGGGARKMLDAVGYRYAEAGRYFTHPNAVIAVTKDLETAKFMFGTEYDVDEALAIAMGRSDWVRQYGPLILVFSLATCIGSAIYLVTLLQKR